MNLQVVVGNLNFFFSTNYLGKNVRNGVKMVPGPGSSELRDLESPQSLKVGLRDPLRFERGITGPPVKV